MRFILLLSILVSTVVNAAVDTTLTSTTFLYGTMSNGRYKVLINEDFVDRYDTTASTVTMTYNNFGDFSSIPNGKVQIDMSHSTTSFVYKCNAVSVPIPVKSIGAKNYNPAITTSVTLSRILHATQDATTGLTTFYILGEKSSFDTYTTTSSITSLIPKNQGVTAGGSAWSLIGNSGTNNTNFIGTTDSKDLILKTNGIERSRFGSNGQWITQVSFSPNDTFLVSVTNNGLGLGVGTARMQHSTHDGKSGAVALDGSGFGKTRNYSVYGFTDFAAKNSFLETGYDSTSRLAWLQLQVQNNINRYTVRLATDSGLVVNCPLYYTDGTQGADKVLTSNAIGAASWKSLYAWSLTGNRNTDSTNFIGTIDNQPLLFRQNDSAYGYFSETNIAIGFNAGQQLTESIGSRNVYIGYEAGRYDAGGGPSTADDNIGIGNQTLLLNKGVSNIAIGSTALDNNISGNQNIAIGEGAKTLTDSTSEALAIGNGAVASANQINFSQIYNSLYLDLGTSDIPCVGCILTNVDGVGSASWQPVTGVIVLDSIDATGATISPAVNTTHVITSAGAIVSATLDFPTGVTGNWIDIVFSKAIATLTNSGVGAGLVSLASPSLGTSKRYVNIGGNWY